MTVIATGYSDVNAQQALPTLTPVTRPAAPARKSAPARPASKQSGSMPINVSRPASASSSSNNDKEFDIPDFLKRSRL